MNRNDPAQTGGKESAAETPGRIPDTDVQPDDAGTADSGNGDKDMASEKAMKQTSKTPAERGSADAG